MNGKVFITGGTGYIGSRLIPVLLARGHQVKALVRQGSQGKLPPGCEAVFGNALAGDSYASEVRGCATFIQLVGVAHPSPAKAREFLAVDQKSALEAVALAPGAGVEHFIYLSVAHPAPAMHAYIAARTVCENALVAACEGEMIRATILRPWYVLGPGHRWPHLLKPFYWIAGKIPSTRDGARRLGLVTVQQMVEAIARAVEQPPQPPQAVKIVEVPEIRGS